MTSTQGLILFAHGARDPRWAEPFESVAARLRSAHPGALVRLAYLEFMAPALPAAGAELVAAGCTQVHIVPLFLGAGGHVRRDLPALVAQMRLDHPAATFALHHAAGEDPLVIEALAGAAARVLA